MLNFLSQITPIGQPNVKDKYNPFAADADVASFKHPPTFAAGFTDRLDAGIDKFADNLVDPRPIFKNCGFYRDAFANGGKDHKQDLWMYAVLGTTFMENGRVYAHEISKGHATYTPADTNAMFDRKVAERHDLGLGYPQCSTIQGAGCKTCATCPLRAKGKSPLNIRPTPKVTATVSPAAGDGPQADPSFVDPFSEFVGPAFPLDILPPTLATFVDAEHRAMGADPAAIAMAALTAVAGAMHAETQVRAGDGWWEPPPPLVDELITKTYYAIVDRERSDSKA